LLDTRVEGESADVFTPPRFHAPWPSSEHWTAAGAAGPLWEPRVFASPVGVRPVCVLALVGPSGAEPRGLAHEGPGDSPPVDEPWWWFPAGAVAALDHTAGGRAVWELAVARDLEDLRDAVDRFAPGTPWPCGGLEPRSERPPRAARPAGSWDVVRSGRAVCGCPACL